MAEENNTTIRNRMSGSVLLFVLFACVLSGCSNGAAPLSLPVVDLGDWEWKADDQPSASWSVRWHYVCKKSGRMDDATVWEPSKDNRTASYYRLWVRGSDFGEYASLEQAKKAGEKQIVRQGLKCEGEAQQ